MKVVPNHLLSPLSIKVGVESYLRPLTLMLSKVHKYQLQSNLQLEEVEVVVEAGLLFNIN